ncbi:hypothetical protein MLD52_11925 [Puniceicoccaceae bacterium K14]|nr:hypothetical protein [Puniceicoccaceae bacterium K14]
MWGRIDYSEWQTLFPKIGFALFALAFAAIVWRALRMKTSEAEKSRNLPLQDD